MFKLKYANTCQKQPGSGDCEYFSIWSSGAKIGKSFSDFFNISSFLGPEMFPFIYWIVLILTVMGMVSEHMVSTYTNEIKSCT